LLAAVALTTLVVGPATAMYRWTEADGRVVYSDKPPPDGRVDRILKRAPPPDPDSVKALSEAENGLRERQQQRDLAADKARKQAVDARTRADECGKLRANLDALSSPAQVYRVDDKGQRELLDDESRGKAAKEAAALLQRNCR
jgi:hypothetical protein